MPATTHARTFRRCQLANRLRVMRGTWSIYSNTPRHAPERRDLARFYRRLFERYGHRRARMIF
jgi:hypothetical protein